jgi:hypothetical protein
VTFQALFASHHDMIYEFGARRNSSAFDRVRTLMERISILSRDNLARNDSLMRDFAVEFTRLADGLVKTVRPAPDQALRPTPS